MTSDVHQNFTVLNSTWVRAQSFAPFKVRLPALRIYNIIRVSMGGDHYMTLFLAKNLYFTNVTKIPLSTFLRTSYFFAHPITLLLQILGALAETWRRVWGTEKILNDLFFGKRFHFTAQHF